MLKREEAPSMIIPQWFRTDVPVVKETFGVQVIEAPKPTPPSNRALNDNISSANTTLIGDQVANSFKIHDVKWLVQAEDRATVGSVMKNIQDDTYTCQRRYVFINIGHNQLDMAHRNTIKPMFQSLIKLIRDKKPAG